MKLLTILCVTIFALVSANPVEKKVLRRYDPREDDPKSRNYFLVEKEKGTFVVEDLENAKVELQASKDDVTIYFYTNSNSDDPLVLTVDDVDLLASSKYYSKSKDNFFITHGWNNDHTSPVNQLIKAALMESTDVNIFVIDWSGPANKNYITAKGSVVEIGAALGDFINSMIDTIGVSTSSFILSGHSLGAHVSGNAGARVNGQVKLIVGMDPASPLFTIANTDNRLDPTDADFVHVIHTCGGLLGFSSSIGHSDYFPNGGSSQPGCGLDLAGTCAHSRSYQYFAESIRQNNFISRECSDINTYKKGSCSSNTKSLMGGRIVDTSVEGDFYLVTNSEEPFGEGE